MKNHTNADALNRLIYEFMAMIEKKELELWQQGRRISLELLKDVLSTSENKTSFIPFFRQEIANSTLKESTKRNHLSTLSLLQQFKKDVTFSDLTFEFISSFEYFLQSRGYHTNTIAKHMKHLKRHINVAINKDYIEIQKYAFRKYKIKTIENKHTHLSPDSHFSHIGNSPMLVRTLSYGMESKIVRRGPQQVQLINGWRYLLSFLS